MKTKVQLNESINLNLTIFHSLNYHSQAFNVLFSSLQNTQPTNCWLYGVPRLKNLTRIKNILPTKVV